MFVNFNSILPLRQSRIFKISSKFIFLLPILTYFQKKEEKSFTSPKHCFSSFFNTSLIKEEAAQNIEKCRI